MGIVATLTKRTDPKMEVIYFSANNQTIRTDIRVRTTKKRQWPEITLQHRELNIFTFEGDGGRPREMLIRIHGVTIPALLNALLDNPDTRAYLADGIAYQDAQQKA
jgi:hypothetical protein